MTKRRSRMRSGVKSKTNCTELGRALVRKYSFSRIKKIIESKKEKVNKKCNCGNYHIRQAIESKHPANVIKLLLDNGANIESIQEDGFNTLNYAMYIGSDPSIIELLLKYKPDTNNLPEHEVTPLISAIYATYPLNILDLLVKNGANVNKTIDSKTTPLHVASFLNKTPYMKKLIELGAKVNAKDIYGRTPLAKSLGYYVSKEAVELLLANGANKNVKDKKDYTLLQHYMTSLCVSDNYKNKKMMNIVKLIV